jgi:hypothetical protein
MTKKASTGLREGNANPLPGIVISQISNYGFGRLGSLAAEARADIRRQLSGAEQSLFSGKPTSQFQCRNSGIKRAHLPTPDRVCK